MLFLFEWRGALISLVAIPLSLMAALLVLYLRGATINTMMLAGLVIAVGRGGRRRDHRRREHRPAAAAAAPAGGSASRPASIILEASLEVRGAIVYATLINVVAQRAGLPPGAACPARSSGRSRCRTRWPSLASMVVALTVTPALALIMLRRAPLERRESPLVRWLQRGYSRGSRCR